MDTTENSAALPRCQTIVYDDLLASLEGAINLALFLQERLPAKWHDLYRASVDRPTNIVRFRHGSFEYVYDLYSQLEVTGEVPYDQTAEDRVVAICGTSTPYDSSNGPRRMRCWLGTGGLLPANRDRGHFIAHSIGGRHDVNVFSQDRDLNRGWCPQGKVFRLMERHCQEHPGTFCFSRPVYADTSSVPRWIEFGLLKEDEKLWVEAFDNIID